MDQRSPLKAVLFDFDGTLVHLEVDWDRLRAWLRGLFAPFGFDSPFRPLLACLQEAEGHLRATAGLERASEVMAQAWAFCREEEVRAARRSQWLPGAPEVLEWLRGHGIPFAVVSNNHSDAVRATLAYLGCQELPVIVGRDRVRRPKPHPEGVRRALTELNYPQKVLRLSGDPSVGSANREGPPGKSARFAWGYLKGDAHHTWMVGDTRLDVEVGMALGMRTVLVLSPDHPLSLDLVGYPGLLVIPRLDELIPFLEDGAKGL